MTRPGDTPDEPNQDGPSDPESVGAESVSGDFPPPPPGAEPPPNAPPPPDIEPAAPTTSAGFDGSVEESDEIDIDDTQATPVVSDPVSEHRATEHRYSQTPSEPDPGEQTAVQSAASPYEHFYANDQESEGAAVPPAGPADPDDIETDGDEPKSPRWGRRVLLGGALLVAAAYVGGYFLTGMRMPANATVSGVDVSGMSPAKARSTLESELTPRTERDIVLTRADKQFAIKPTDAGMALDVPTSVDEAGGERSWDPRDMAALFFGEHRTDAVVDTDPTKFAGVLGSISESVDVPVVQPQITFPEGKPEARQPKDGVVLDKTETTEVMKKAYVGDGEPVELAMKTVRPDVNAEGLEAAMGGIAQTVISGPVAIKVGDKSLDLPTSAFLPATVIRVEDSKMKPFIDPKTLAKPLLSSTTGIGKKAVDATVKFEDGKPKVVEGKAGVGLQPDEMAVKLLPAISARGAERSVAVEAKVVEPEFTTEDAEKLQIVERISSFRSEYPPAQYRDINQGNAADRINGTIIKPGETFSFNQVVGERTEANGFVSGTVINGGVFREELGGGVSQVATTMYNVGFFGAMDDIEHHPHAFWIDRYPVGREATVYWGSLDLRWRNSSPYGVLIRAWVDKSAPGRNGAMNAELWSTKVYDIKAGQSAKRNFRSPGTQYDDSNRCVSQSPIEGFDIDIYRTFYQGGKKIKTETDTAVYQAADRVVCGKKPDSD